MGLWAKTKKTELFNSYKKLGSTDEACDLIINISAKWATFWPTSHGWAPSIAADLMTQELMDRHLEMAHALKKWPKRLLENDAQGEFVLAWVNLGSVIEGALKIYMDVFYADWLKDADAPTKKGQKQTPNASFFDRLIQFVSKKELFKADEIKFFEKVRDQRNLIHPMKIGTVLDGIAFAEAVMHTAAFHDDVEGRLPDPYG